MLTRRQTLALALLWGSSLLLFSCGRKGPPVVPELKAPVAPDQLSAVGRDNRVFLTWVRPTKNLSGKPLRDLMEFEIYRREMKEGEEGSSAVLIAKVKAIMPENASVRGNLYEYVDDAGGRGLSYDRQYAYLVKAVNFSQEAGPPSKEVMVSISPSPNPPTDLTALAGDGAVFLSWKPSRGRVDGRELARAPWYNIYRGKSSSRYEGKPVNPEPIAEHSYADVGLQNEVRYHYVVRALDNEFPPGQESLDSNEASAVPTDTTPPSRPRNLSCVAGSEGVRLAWDPNPEPDLLGYFVYRSLYPGIGHVRLNAVPETKITFVDQTISPSVSYYYAVSAVDSSPRQNESGFSEEVRAEAP
jgi:hypothetical protein